MTTEQAVVAIIVAIASGGLVGGIVAWRKAGPERTNIIVDSAEVVIRLSREEIDRLDKANDRLEVRLGEVEHELGKRIAELEVERDQLKAELAEERRAKETLQKENVELSDRVRGLEEEVVRLREGGTT